MLLYLLVLCMLWGSCHRSYGFNFSSSEFQDSKEIIQEETFLNYGMCTTCEEISANIEEKDVSKYVKVYVFTRQTGDNYSEIALNNLTSFSSSAFNLQKNTKMIVHGWLTGGLGSYEMEIKDAYLAAQDVNVLCVDWSRGAENFYTLARNCVVPVGTFLATFVDWLVSEAGVTLSSLHVIGHSLGAHVAGIIGEHLTVGVLSRISGLDPAGPEFLSNSTSGRLDSSDAQFVDVIHTCGHFAGYFNPCGHVDFYPNGGEPPQPGCGIPILTCAHVRSHDLFNESISSLGFVSTSCSTWDNYKSGNCTGNSTTIMGEHVDMSARGNFYLETAGSYPFALGYNNSAFLTLEDDF